MTKSSMTSLQSGQSRKRKQDMPPPSINTLPVSQGSSNPSTSQIPGQTVTSQQNSVNMIRSTTGGDRGRQTTTTGRSTVNLKVPIESVAHMRHDLSKAFIRDIAMKMQNEGRAITSTTLFEECENAHEDGPMYQQPHWQGHQLSSSHHNSEQLENATASLPSNSHVTESSNRGYSNTGHGSRSNSSQGSFSSPTRSSSAQANWQSGGAEDCVDGGLPGMEDCIDGELPGMTGMFSGHRSTSSSFIPEEARGRPVAAALTTSQPLRTNNSRETGISDSLRESNNLSQLSPVSGATRKAQDTRQSSGVSGSSERTYVKNESSANNATEGAEALQMDGYLLDELSGSTLLSEQARNTEVKLQESSGPKTTVTDLQQYLKRGLFLVQKEHELLKVSRQCSKCHINPRDITFLPCGHFTTCRECAGPIYICPVCNKNVLATVDTFLS